MWVRAGLEKEGENYVRDGSITRCRMSLNGEFWGPVCWHGPGKYFSEARSVCPGQRGRTVNRCDGYVRQPVCQVSLAGRDRVGN